MDPNTGFMYMPIVAIHPLDLIHNFDFSISTRYDMSELSGKQYKLKNGDDTFAISICELPASATRICAGQAGACKTTNGQMTSQGVINDNMQLKDAAIGTPFLQYKDGGACVKKDGSPGTRLTTIEFICHTDGMADEPQIVEDYGCEIIIHFPTKKACQSPVSGRDRLQGRAYSNDRILFTLFQVQCKTYDYESGREFDVTPLIKTSGNYHALINEKLLQDSKSKLSSSTVVSTNRLFGLLFVWPEAKCLVVQRKHKRNTTTAAAPECIYPLIRLRRNAVHFTKFNYTKMRRQKANRFNRLSQCISAIEIDSMSPMQSVNAMQTMFCVLHDVRVCVCLWRRRAHLFPVVV